jgi:hypothetical protein
MTTVSRLSLAAILTVLLFGQPTYASASDQSGAAVRELDSAAETASELKSFDEIVSLRLRINTHNEVSLLAKSVVAGRWDDTRRIPVGTRLYYEVIDYSGNVVAKGFRKDPRSLYAGRSVDFLLTAPYNEECASVNLYVVDYENGGRGGYSRNYALLGTFDIRGHRTASLD